MVMLIRGCKYAKRHTLAHHRSQIPIYNLHTGYCHSDIQTVAQTETDGGDGGDGGEGSDGDSSTSSKKNH